MRTLVRFLDEQIPYIDDPEFPVHEDPYHPITSAGRRMLEQRPENEIPIGWWHRKDRYAERLSPGTKFADIIGEIDPAKLARRTSLSAEEALHCGKCIWPGGKASPSIFFCSPTGFNRTRMCNLLIGWRNRRRDVSFLRPGKSSIAVSSGTTGITAARSWPE